MLGHLIPLLFAFSSPEWVERLAESRLLMVTALVFIPVTLMHGFRDKKIHDELHRLQEVEDDYLELKNEVFQAERERRETY
jgi:hypothetical protein